MRDHKIKFKDDQWEKMRGYSLRWDTDNSKIIRDAVKFYLGYFKDNPTNPQAGKEVFNYK